MIPLSPVLCLPPPISGLLRREQDLPPIPCILKSILHLYHLAGPWCWVYKNGVMIFISCVLHPVRRIAQNVIPHLCNKTNKRRLYRTAFTTTLSPHTLADSRFLVFLARGRFNHLLTI